MKGRPFEYDRDAAALELSEYLRLPFTQFAQEGIGSYANPVAMWNAKVKSYLAVDSHPKILIRHEDLFDLDVLSSKLMKLTEHGFVLRPGAASISYPPLQFSNVSNLVDKYQFTIADFHGAKAYAQNREHWVSQFKQRDLHFIAGQLDGSVLAELNYTIESVASSVQQSDEQEEGSSPVRAAPEALVAEGVTDSKKSILLRAERHTGSHFLASILRRNFPKGAHQQVYAEPIMHSSVCPVQQPLAASSSCCWKHGLADANCRYADPPAAYVFLVRHPYSWLLAMKANPYEYDGYWLQVRRYARGRRPSL
jgi:hypothetical protein